MWLVVGLGNPGGKYVGTRHNVGFEVLDELARRWSADRPKLRFEAELREISLAGSRTLLVAPQTFMNLSGRAVSQVVGFYKVPFENVMVVCDDLNLKLGQLRMRRGGSAGGQKGLHSILQALATEEVPRLRIGIDRNPPDMDSAAYVLSRFRTDELPVIEAAIRRASTSVEVWVQQGIDAAMNQTNATVPE
uniref:Peptidyl-tRNA hydrolase n=1 Tax=Schlesneria paludicola TaxID=360056 RepID=A0A7C4QP85_9PLAN